MNNVFLNKKCLPFKKNHQLTVNQAYTGQIITTLRCFRYLTGKSQNTKVPLYNQIHQIKK
ncbi:hypothetical protein AFM12_09210 [Jiulongibacter sediminis]|uniref:Uncharacterized protein n=1 Tax=Jiulongibacter sediminis TaxID=1605367 RepID=A0A0P7BV39_9BACT|nr:hypothetical protein AFM12_09210 [Jiulongibacter sediminis]TBX25283.1 hypothetical protein TK44_09215 [Jiulongibacter sediminis]